LEWYEPGQHVGDDRQSRLLQRCRWHVTCRRSTIHSCAKWLQLVQASHVQAQIRTSATVVQRLVEHTRLGVRAVAFERGVRIPTRGRSRANTQSVQAKVSSASPARSAVCLTVSRYSPYDILSLDETAKPEDVKRKYRQLSLCEHNPPTLIYVIISRAC
jgi:hypothetical protein